MSWSLVGTSVDSASAVAVPAGTANGDLLVLYGHNRSGATAPGLPAGFTSRASTTLGGRGNVVGTRVASSEPASYSVDASRDYLLACYRWSGGAAAFDAISAGQTFSVSNTAVTAVASSNADELSLVIGGGDGTSAPASDAITGYAADRRGNGATGGSLIALSKNVGSGSISPGNYSYSTIQGGSNRDIFHLTAKPGSTTYTQAGAAALSLAAASARQRIFPRSASSALSLAASQAHAYAGKLLAGALTLGAAAQRATSAQRAAALTLGAAGSKLFARSRAAALAPASAFAKAFSEIGAPAAAPGRGQIEYTSSDFLNDFAYAGVSETISCGEPVTLTIAGYWTIEHLSGQPLILTDVQGRALVGRRRQIPEGTATITMDTGPGRCVVRAGSAP